RGAIVPLQRIERIVRHAADGRRLRRLCWRGILRCRLLCRRLLRRRLIAARRTREAAIGDVVGFDILELARRRETLNGAARRQCDVILELTLADDPRAAIGWAPLD